MTATRLPPIFLGAVTSNTGVNSGADIAGDDSAGCVSGGGERKGVMESRKSRMAV